MLSIVIPVYNEARYLNRYLLDLYHDLKKAKLKFKIILCENGSTDQTRTLAQKLAHRYQEIIVISSPIANYGLAVKNGFLAAKGEYLVLFDLDYYDVGFLKTALNNFKNFHAIVGAKRSEGSRDLRHPTRRLITLGFSLILKTFFGMQISDTHGIKILKRRPFIPIIKKCRFTKEIFDTELLIRAEYEGLRISQIGVQVKEKRASRTSILKRALRTLLDLFKLKLVLIKEYD